MTPIEEARAWLTQLDTDGVARKPSFEEWTGWLRQLLAVAEAADLYVATTGKHYWRCEYRTVAMGWKHGEPPIIECVCGLDALDELLHPEQVTSGV